MHLLSEETTTTAADRFASSEVALLPTGSVEQHGPALPLGTDWLTAEAIARAAAGEDEVVLPTVPVGVSAHHRQFDGTLWAEPETFEDYVGEIVASVASHGIRKVVLVNGHGGNVDALRRAARRLRGNRSAFAVPWNWWDSLDGLEAELFEGPTGHAGGMETSMMMRVASELVREAALEEAQAGASDGWGKRVHGAEIGFDTLDFSESGAVGRPTEATAEKGRRLYDRAGSELEALIDWLSDQPFDALMPEPHR